MEPIDFGPGRVPLRSIELYFYATTSVLCYNSALRRALAIPAFDEHGSLPPGIYEATWSEIVDRFGGTPKRQQLLAGLRAALDLLAVCGCRRAWLDGSFVTDVEQVEGRLPGDVDVCWEITGVDLAQLSALAPEFHPLSGAPAVRHQRYGGDYFAVSEPLAPGMVEQFQWARGARRKGIVVLEPAEGRDKR